MRATITLGQAAKRICCTTYTVKKLYEQGDIEGCAVESPIPNRPKFLLYLDSVESFILRHDKEVSGDDAPVEEKTVPTPVPTPALSLETVSPREAAMRMYCSEGAIMLLYEQGELKGYNRGGVGKPDIRIYKDSLRMSLRPKPAVVQPVKPKPTVPEPSLPQTPPFEFLPEEAEPVVATTKVKKNIDLREAAALLGCSGETVKRLFKAGEVGGFLVGLPGTKKPRYRIYVTSLEAYIKRRENRESELQEKYQEELLRIEAEKRFKAQEEEDFRQKVAQELAKAKKVDKPKPEMTAEEERLLDEKRARRRVLDRELRNNPANQRLKAIVAQWRQQKENEKREKEREEKNKNK